MILRLNRHTVIFNLIEAILQEHLCHGHFQNLAAPLPMLDKSLPLLQDVPFSEHVEVIVLSINHRAHNICKF